VPKWIVTSSNTWEVEAETGWQAINMAERDPIGLGGGLPEYSAETEDGEQPCEGCGKPATTADIEGVPLCKECMDDMLNEPEINEDPPAAGAR
jgi:hypothetical protein